jgi:hypothetical protein
MHTQQAYSGGVSRGMDYIILSIIPDTGGEAISLAPHGDNHALPKLKFAIFDI